MDVKIVISFDHLEKEDSQIVLKTAKSLFKLYASQNETRIAEAEKNGESIYIDVSNPSEPIFFRSGTNT